MMQVDGPVAYFSMEMALDSALPTYSGGLGVLAGDTLRAAADLRLPVVGVTLVHRKGYFFQALDGAGCQVERPVRWSPEDGLELTPARVAVQIDGADVALRVWKRVVRSAGGGEVPVFLLDSDLPENKPEHRWLTDHLYGGDHDYRLRQEIILGIGGVRALRALGIDRCGTYHMNEGHAALLTAELLREHAVRTGDRMDSGSAAAAVRARCVFTTHTPVAAGHDRFDVGTVNRIAGEGQVYATSPLFVHEGKFDTTHSGISLSRFVNAVSVRHAEVSRRLFPGAPIEPITNGVHPGTWVAPAMRVVFDRHAPGWEHDSDRLVGVRQAGDAELLGAHRAGKRELIRRVNSAVNAGMSEAAFTIGIARRATGYKRLDLLLSDPGRLAAIAAEFGPVQVVYAGKAHPRDGAGKELVRRLVEWSNSPPQAVRVAFVPGYDMDLARLLVSGSDVWLNTPERPLEASGTSGMKAALNGVPSLSTLDGWWLEGWQEGVTGWAIGDDGPILHYPEDWGADADSLYRTLSAKVLPLYHAGGSGWASVMRSAITLNGTRFSTHRMVRDYAKLAYAKRG